MNLATQRQAELSSAQAIIGAAKARGGDLTPMEESRVESHLETIRGLDGQIDKAAKSADLMSRIANLGGPGGSGEEDGSMQARSLGEHFANSVGAKGFALLKSVGGYKVHAPEFKAATDPQTVPGSFAPALTDVDTRVVQAYRRPSVADLLGVGQISGNAVTYFVEGAVEGSITTVAEGAQKPQIHIGDPTAVTDTLKKIAAWWDASDEMTEDVPFWVSEVNNRGLYLLSMAEEAQLLSGNGTGSNVLGLLNRSGIQTGAQAVAPDSAADAIFRAMTSVQTASGLSADGIFIHPTDYQALRLSKDGNEQYYGGGYFAGQYGVGGVLAQPPLWGLNTVVTAAVPAKTVVVGAFKAATTVYRKGGVRVESTNSDLGKFTKNIITTRIEERFALAVRIPAAIVKVTLL